MMGGWASLILQPNTQDLLAFLSSLYPLPPSFPLVRSPELTGVILKQTFPHNKILDFKVQARLFFLKSTLI